MKPWKLVGMTALIVLPGIPMTALAAGKVSGNISAVSTYVWRGLSQTVDAALQGGIDYSTPEGIHAGIWTSNVAGGSELDFTIGYAGNAKDINYDVGFIAYNFPQYEAVAGANEDYNFNELYVSVSKDFLNARFSTSSEAGSYIEVNANFDKAVADWDLGLHFGSYSVEEDFAGLAYSGDADWGTPGENYSDYSASLGTKVNGLDVSFALSNTSINDDSYRTIVKVARDF